MSIYKEAKKEDSPEAYAKMQQKYADMSYSDVFYLLRDAQSVLETKCILGMDTTCLLDSEFSTLLKEAEKVGDLAQSCQIALSVHQRHRALTSLEWNAFTKEKERGKQP